MTIYAATFQIRGLSPLVQHNPASMLGAKTGAKSQKQRKPDPAVEAEAGAYRMPGSQQLYCKAVGFKKGLLYASTGKKIGRFSAGRLMQAGVFEIDEICPLFRPVSNGKREPIEDYEVYIAPVVVQDARILRARPRLWPWATAVTLEVNDDYVSPQQVGELLREAGRMAGLQDDRPETGGRHGRYKVLSMSIEELEQEEELPLAA